MSNRPNSQIFRATIDYKDKGYFDVFADPQINCGFQTAEQLHRVIKDIAEGISNEITNIKIMKCLPQGQCSEQPDDRILDTYLTIRPFDMNFLQGDNCIYCQDLLPFIELSSEESSNFKLLKVEDIERVLLILNPESLPFRQRIMQQLKNVKTFIFK